PGESELEKLPPSEFRVPCYARFGLERHEFCPEPHPSIKPLHQAVPLWERVYGIHRFAVEEPEIASIGRNDDMASSFHEVIVSPLKKTLWQGPGPRFLAAAHHLKTFLPLFQ